MSDPHEHPEEERKEPGAAPTPTIDVRVLFGEHREIWLEHEGVRYRLRITRRNKLILQK
jgi:hemin uptake protein HemP